MTLEFIKTFDSIKLKHDEAFKIVDQAVRFEEEEHPDQALDWYKKGINIIDETLAIPVGVPDDINSVQSEWDQACKLIHKLKRARAEIVQRVGVLSKSVEKSVTSNNAEPSPSGSNSEQRPRTYSELAKELRTMQCTGQGGESLELLFSCEGVKLYSIRPNGLVTTEQEDSILRIVRMEQDEKKHLSATFFIQIIKSSHAVRIQNFEREVENSFDVISSSSSTSSFEDLSNSDLEKEYDVSWLYPLIPGVSPCYRTDFGAFILPDLEATEQGTSFGIVVPKELGADEIVLEILEGILHGVVIQTTEAKGEVPPEADLSVKVSENIVKGAFFVSQNIIKGAEKAGQLITYSTPYIMSKIGTAPPNPEPVSKNVQTTVEVAKCVTETAAGITGYIAGKVGSATMALGRFLAPHLQKHGSTLLTKGFGMNETEAQEKMSGVLTIAAGAVEGFGTVYAGLEESASILGRNLSSNSVKIIEHKYGSSAGSVAARTFDTVGNVINLTQNVNIITPKGLAKRTAKNTGKAIVEEYKPKIQVNTVPASALYPDLSGLQAQVKK